MPTPVRELTRHCFDCLIMDVWPRSAAVVDFGLNSTNHYGALQHAVKNGVTAEELDDALGDGAKITALCERFPNSPYKATFRTPYDEFKDDEDD